MKLQIFNSQFSILNFLVIGMTATVGTLHAQLITNIISPDRLITWEGNVGIPGGIPERTTVYTNVLSGTSMSEVQTRLNNCPSNQVVLLTAGDYTNSGGLSVPSFVTLRGTNAIMHFTGSGYGGGDTEVGMGIYFGTSMFGSRGGGGPGGVTYNISSGYTKDSTSIVLASAPGAVTGYLMTIDQLNDTNFVSLVGQYGTSTASGRDSGARAMGQTVEITGVSGSTVTFTPPLYYTLTSGLDPEAVVFNPQVKMAGVEGFTFKCYSNGLGMVVGIGSSKHIWVTGNEFDFADRDMMRVGSSFGFEITGNYFHDSYIHGSGSYDNPVMLFEKSSAGLVQNNRFKRLHTPVMLNSGASGNVIAYNFSENTYDTVATNVMMYDYNLNHRAHPSFNLFEGNMGDQFRGDRSWGTSSHMTLFRNYGTGASYIERPFNARGELFGGYWAHQALRCFSVDSGQNYYNLVGNIALARNTPSGGVTFLAVYPDSVTYNNHLYEFNFGQSDVGTSTYPSNDCFLTVTMEGNYSGASNAVIWTTNATYTNLSAIKTLYLPGGAVTNPTWFGNLSIPAFVPSNTNTATKLSIPAGYLDATGSNPPPAGDVASLPVYPPVLRP